MKQFVVLFCLFLLMAEPGFGQKGFVVRNKIKGKEKVLIEGKRIKIVKKDGTVIRGKLNFIIPFDSDSITGLNIDYNVIKLDEINLIKTQIVFLKVLGGTMTTGGCVVTVIGLDLLIEGIWLYSAWLGIYSSISYYTYSWSSNDRWRDFLCTIWEKIFFEKMGLLFSKSPALFRNN